MCAFRWKVEPLNTTRLSGDVPGIGQKPSSRLRPHLGVRKGYVLPTGNAAARIEAGYGIGQPTGSRFATSSEGNAPKTPQGKIPTVGHDAWDRSPRRRLFCPDGSFHRFIHVSFSQCPVIPEFGFPIILSPIKDGAKQTLWDGPTCSCKLLTLVRDTSADVKQPLRRRTLDLVAFISWRANLNRHLTKLTVSSQIASQTYSRCSNTGLRFRIYCTCCPLQTIASTRFLTIKATYQVQRIRDGLIVTSLGIHRLPIGAVIRTQFPLAFS